MYVEEAKAKLDIICPQKLACNSYGRCLGSECMAWRWQVTHTPNYPYEAKTTVSDTVGYCGIAGRPEA